MNRFYLCFFCILLCFDHISGIKEESRQILFQRKFKWVNLTEDELQRWYNPTDLCILNSTIVNKFPQDIRINQCKQYSHGNRRQFCGVGMGNNNYPCYGPFSTARPHFKMGVEGYTDPSAAPLLDLFTYLTLTKTTLMLLGDSTMRQKLQSLTCELMRETDGHVRFMGDLFGIVPCHTVITFTFPAANHRRFRYPPVPKIYRELLRKNTKHHPLAGQSISISAISLGPKSIDCFQKLLRKESKDGLDPGNDYRLTVSNVTLSNFSWKKHLSDQGIFGNAANIVNEVNFQQNRSVFMLTNMGLWYNEENDYLTALSNVLPWLLSVAQRNYSSSNSNNFGVRIKNVVAWHETLLQHWYNSYGTGYYNSYESKEYAKEVIAKQNISLLPLSDIVSPFLCPAIRNNSRLSDWRNELFKEFLDENFTYQKHFTVLPVAEISRYDVPSLSPLLLLLPSDIDDLDH